MCWVSVDACVPVPELVCFVLQSPDLMKWVDWAKGLQRVISEALSETASDHSLWSGHGQARVRAGSEGNGYNKSLSLFQGMFSGERSWPMFLGSLYCKLCALFFLSLQKLSFSGPPRSHKLFWVQIETHLELWKCYQGFCTRVSVQFWSFWPQNLGKVFFRRATEVFHVPLILINV